MLRRDHEDEAKTQCSFYLAPTDGGTLPAFEPGQYLTFRLRVPGPGGEEREITRCYSLSARPGSDAYRVTIKRVAAPPERSDLPPGASSNHFHDRVQVGERLRVRGPSGRFTLDRDASAPVVLVAGGIGITPLMSMLQESLATRPDRAIHLYYGLRSGDVHAFKQELEDLARTHASFRLHVSYSQPRPADLKARDFHHEGHVDVGLLRSTLPHGRHRFYVCGPPAMMSSLLPALREWGVAPEDLRHEAFGPASMPADQPAPSEGLEASVAGPVEVHFRRAGRTIAWNGTDATLLDLAERHGVDVPSGCRAGSCGSCETRLISGSVRYAHAPDHEPAPGTCLLCAATPESALVLEA